MRLILAARILSISLLRFQSCLRSCRLVALQFSTSLFQSPSDIIYFIYIILQPQEPHPRRSSNLTAPDGVRLSFSYWIGYRILSHNDIIYQIAMAKRLNILQQTLAGKNSKIGDSNKIVRSAFDYLSLSDYLTPEEKKYRLAIREFVEREITTKIIPYIQTAQFPTYLLPLLRQQQVLHHFFPKPYGFGSRVTLQGVILAEIAKGDAGIATLMVATRLLGFTLMEFASKQQQERYLPEIVSLKTLGAWALTELNVGSDAAHIETTAERTTNGYRINGVKNWIGNGTADLLCLWAKNKQTKNLEAFLLQTKGLKGLQVQAIKNKMVLRSISHCRISLNDVEVGQSQRLPHVGNFQSSIVKGLQSSRVAVLWVATGICMGSYEAAIKYATNRQQFGRSISSFQMIQQKLVNMMATIQGMLLLCFRISKLVEEGQSQIGMISMAKAWITERGREVCRWGRQICGGNGLLHENYVIRAMADIEATFTYEGTYDINTLIAGRDITGVSAFK